MDLGAGGNGTCVGGKTGPRGRARENEYGQEETEWQR